MNGREQPDKTDIVPLADLDKAKKRKSINDGRSCTRCQIILWLESPREHRIGSSPANDSWLDQRKSKERDTNRTAVLTLSMFLYENVAYLWKR